MEKRNKPRRTPEAQLKAADKLMKALSLEIKKVDKILSSWRTKKIC